tara:strand:- start:77 stop:526 length:450 start_codon:yes stop_codon:yes gene_type:complete
VYDFSSPRGTEDAEKSIQFFVGSPSASVRDSIKDSFKKIIGDTIDWSRGGEGVRRRKGKKGRFDADMVDAKSALIQSIGQLRSAKTGIMIREIENWRRREASFGKYLGHLGGKRLIRRASNPAKCAVSFARVTFETTNVPGGSWSIDFS